MRLTDVFGTGQPIIAMVHLPALPGRPRHDKGAGMGLLTDTVARDLIALQAAGVDGLAAVRAAREQPAGT